jgi:hypothetical protein
MTSFQVVRNPDGHGEISVGLGLSSSKHFELYPKASQPAFPPPSGAVFEASGYLLPPNAFPVLLVLVLAQVLSFRLFAVKRYAGKN